MYDVVATRTIEQQAMALVEAHTLMRRAGFATARLACAIAPHARSVWIACGPGNNGGDGLEAALHLHRLGRDVRVTLLADPARQSADARDALSRAQAAGVLVATELDSQHPQCELVIDALLGIGLARAPEGPLAEAVRQVNSCGATCLAIDVPSGLDANTGQPLGQTCIEADHTITLLTLKPGLYTGSGRDHGGTVWLDPLGVEGLGASPTSWLTGAAEARHEARRHAQHKGSFGDVIVLGGAPGMGGAARLAGRAALAAGAGRVFICPLDLQAPLLDEQRLELMFRRADWALELERLSSSTVVCGCGGGDAVRATLEPVLHRAKSLVLDADALNAIAADTSLALRLRQRAPNGLATVLTPHPLEAGRLLGTNAQEVQHDRIAAARSLADQMQAVVLLKGSGSVIAAPERVPYVNPTGNAALASPGTGDVLAGWLGGSWSASGAGDAAGAFQAAVASAWLHGAAADTAHAGPARASDLIEAMHGADRR
jgi:hydroxyethylthiazole kinase-like uncharacterized protein yjeF